MRKLNNKRHSTRKGFAIAYGLFLSFIISLIGVYSLELTSKTNSAIIKENIKTQMNLYIDSTIEYSLLRLSQSKAITNQTTEPTSVDTFTINYPNGYTFEVSVMPIYDINNEIANGTAPAESAGAIILDIKGTYQDNLHPFSISLRTVQKP